MRLLGINCDPQIHPLAESNASESKPGLRHLAGHTAHRPRKYRQTGLARGISPRSATASDTQLFHRQIRDLPPTQSVRPISYVECTVAQRSNPASAAQPNAQRHVCAARGFPRVGTKHFLGHLSCHHTATLRLRSKSLTKKSPRPSPVGANEYSRGTSWSRGVRTRISSWVSSAETIALASERVFILSRYGCSQRSFFSWSSMYQWAEIQVSRGAASFWRTQYSCSQQNPPAGWRKWNIHAAARPGYLHTAR
jgi:hypothetical protein